MRPLRSSKGQLQMSDTTDCNKPAHVRARIAFKATVAALETLGCDRMFSDATLDLLRGCDKLMRIERATYPDREQERAA